MGASLSAGIALARLHGSDGGRWKQALAEITGMDAVTLQPAAGAHGELTGILLIRALLETQRQSAQEDSDSRFGARHQSRHGHDGRLRGRKHQVERTRHGGCGMRSRASWIEDVAALMVTNPNTLGVFEENITHDRGNPARQGRACSTWTAPT